MRMRLLDVHTLEIHDAPLASSTYTIASHRWQEGEVTFQDVVESRQDKPGYQKLRGFADFIKNRMPETRWLWIDTCCIDKRDKSELEIAINSMFDWYQQSRICLAYLHDVSAMEDEAAFRSSEWFKRGWTLQELVAPATVVFLTRSWEVIGYKGKPSSMYQGARSLDSIISEITGISTEVLFECNQARHVAATEMLAWAENRQTTIPEDKAYCLVGLLDVDIRVTYGGAAGRNAMDRLTSKLRKTGKITSMSPTSQLAMQTTVSLPRARAVDTAQHTQFEQLAVQLSRLSNNLSSTYTTQRSMPPHLRKLKSLCDRLTRQLRGLVHFHVQGILDMSLLLTCIQTCAFEAVDIDQLFQRIMVTAAQLYEEVELAENDLEELLEDLETSNTLLKFALDTYHDARNDTQVARTFTNVMASTAGIQRTYDERCLAAHADSRPLVRSSYDVRRHVPGVGTRKRGNAKTRLFHVSLRFSWLSRTVWDFAVLRAERGWHFHLVPSYVVPYDSMVFRLCDSEMWKACDLLSSRAKPHCEIDHWAALHFSKAPSIMVKWTSSI